MNHLVNTGNEELRRALGLGLADCLFEVRFTFAAVKDSLDLGRLKGLLGRDRTIHPVKRRAEWIVGKVHR